MKKCFWFPIIMIIVNKVIYISELKTLYYFSIDRLI